MTQSEEIVLHLAALGLGHAVSVSIPDNIDWQEVMVLAAHHGILAVCFDGMEHLPAEFRPCMELLMEWFGKVSIIENAYAEHKRSLEHFGAFYAKYDMPVMLLKGYGLSLNYPKPSHRPSGDIDSYMFGRWKEADTLLASELGIRIDYSHHHHTVFRFEGQSVEDHYDFINIHSHPSNKHIEQIFKNLAQEKGEQVLPNIFQPTTLLNLLFVARHAALHFASGELIIKQIVDWGTLIAATNKEEYKYLWTEFWNKSQDMGMLPFVLAISDLCIRYLGFDRKLFHIPNADKDISVLADRILEDTLHPHFGGERPKGFLPYIIWMTRRWVANRWKHMIVYKDSLLSTFFYQVLSHLMKPSSLRGQ